LETYDAFTALLDGFPVMAHTVDLVDKSVDPAEVRMWLRRIRTNHRLFHGAYHAGLIGCAFSVETDAVLFKLRFA
jgi:hypothetical protein